MNTEQKMIVENFKKNFENVSKIAIYGTGINAEAVLKSCSEFDIVGVMDASKSGETFCGFRVMSEDEARANGVKCIVIVARPAVHKIIYRRICNFVNSCGIEVYDVYGKQVEISDNIVDNPYYHINCEELMSEMEKYDIISFDIFDTLLTRKAFEPEDVLRLLGEEISGDRINVAKELMSSNPTLDEIYKEIGVRNNLDENSIKELKQKEIEIELKVLCVRGKMVECLEHAINIGKKVILVSDMYYSHDEIVMFLDKFGISGYEKIYVSNEYGITKEDGLWEIVRKDYHGRSMLHIGDNENGDYNKPREVGIAAYKIMSPMKMLEISTHRNILSFVDGLYTRFLAGMIAEKLFNDPFSLYESGGKVKIMDEKTFSYVYMAPIFTSFGIWLIKELKGKDGLFLFALRDGFIIRKIYRLLASYFCISDLPKDEYLLISRRAALDALAGMQEGGDNYKNYMAYFDSLGVKRYDDIYMFDFMSKGTCQYALENMTARKIKGIYFQKSDAANQLQNCMEYQAFYKESSALEADKYVFAMCDFLECILSNENPSLLKIDGEGQPVYNKEIRSDEQISLMLTIHSSILSFVAEFADIVCDFKPGYLGKSMVEFVDELMRCTDVENADIHIDELKRFVLDMNENQIKNTGYDLFSGGKRSDT